VPRYPRSLINEDETVVLDLNPHWWYFARTILTGALLAAVFALWLGVLDQTRWIGYPLALGGILWALWVLYRYFVWSYTHFVVTDRRIIDRSGILAKRGSEIPLEQVQAIDFSQNIWERIIGAGDLLIQSAGSEGRSEFRNVRHPDMVQQEIYRQRDVNARRLAAWEGAAVADAVAARGAGAPGATGPTDADDVAGRIRALVELRDQGLITEAEFEAKKAELLDQL